MLSFAKDVRVRRYWQNPRNRRIVHDALERVITGKITVKIVNLVMDQVQYQVVVLHVEEKVWRKSILHLMLKYLRVSTLECSYALKAKVIKLSMAIWET